MPSTCTHRWGPIEAIEILDTCKRQVILDHIKTIIQVSPQQYQPIPIQNLRIREIWKEPLKIYRKPPGTHYLWVFTRHEGKRATFLVDTTTSQVYVLMLHKLNREWFENTVFVGYLVPDVWRFIIQDVPFLSGVDQREWEYDLRVLSSALLYLDFIKDPKNVPLFESVHAITEYCASEMDMYTVFREHLPPIIIFNDGMHHFYPENINPDNIIDELQRRQSRSNQNTRHFPKTRKRRSSARNHW